MSGCFYDYIKERVPLGEGLMLISSHPPSFENGAWLDSGHTLLLGACQSWRHFPELSTFQPPLVAPSGQGAFHRGRGWPQHARILTPCFWPHTLSIGPDPSIWGDRRVHREITQVSVRGQGAALGPGWTMGQKLLTIALGVMPQPQPGPSSRP